MKNIFILLAIIFTLVGCRKQNSFTIKSLPGLYQRVINKNEKSIATVFIEYENKKEVVFLSL